ncbi:MAG: hypothetical protein AAFZ07_17095 [Actinomycetota bacterium]
MSIPGIIVERTDPADGDVVERWSLRSEDEPLDVVDVEAMRVDDEGEWPWQVHVSVADFLRAESLDVELDISVDRALRSVEGVADTKNDDDVWSVQGAPSGEAVVVAVSAALGRFAARIRIYLEEL